MSKTAEGSNRVDSFPLSYREFVLMMAMLMAVNAFGIDAMLPALPDISATFDIAFENQRQWVVAAYTFGFGVGQILYGPLADRFGRKPILLMALAMFTGTTLLAAFAWDFTSLIAARFAQGATAASMRVLSVAIVRDRYSGAQMARVMSLSYGVFLITPILAPSVGQFILMVAPWRAIFLFLAFFSLFLILWLSLRLPETLHPEYRRPVSVGKMANAAQTVFTNRFALGYMVVSTMMFGTQLGFINSAQQIFTDVFQESDRFPIFFASIAGTMGVMYYVNSRIVERLGTRFVSQCALVGFTAISGIHFLVTLSGNETLVTFMLLQAATMGCYGLATSNFQAMAMEPVGHIAGTASSIQGLFSCVGGAVLGISIGQNFDGSSLPLTASFTMLGGCAFILVFLIEGGQLFRPRAVAKIQSH
ncbi:MAG: multidrug effflux MFS transporter [Sphingobium sp.]